MLLRTRPTDKSHSLREETLFKKANELTVLCDARVSIIMISSTRKIHEFISPSTSNEDNLWEANCREKNEEIATRGMKFLNCLTWPFGFSMLHKVSRSFAFIIQQLDIELRKAVCIFYLVLRALDTVEDDTSVATDVKVPILKDFYRHIYDRNWHFSCGTKNYKVLIDKFHHVSTAFLELKKGYQEAIEDITKRMGAEMAKFICKEVETVDDYDEYCHYVAGLVGLGLYKLFHACGTKDLAPDSLSN
ncbi:Squalene synthase [Hibiscus syriacus]|uniref:Squalene synthase n=1 Tax=Hibiscus syriacus TaxID=106335 RepID=A0A6A2ZUX9_HIBSY|nr:Squalene synthase [Hibiscus syriacus]